MFFDDSIRFVLFEQRRNISIIVFLYDDFDRLGFLSKLE